MDKRSSDLIPSCQTVAETTSAGAAGEMTGNEGTANRRAFRRTRFFDMNIRHIALAMLTGTVAAAFTGCNSSTPSIEQTASNAAVKTFNISSEAKGLEGLDSVFFSIDLVHGRIFNADSLPIGTRVKALVPKIVTYSGASVAQLTVSRAGRPDTIIDYLKSSNDTIDFTNPVKLRLVSTDGLVERNYIINVNVHRVKADSLAWSRADRTTLPSSFGLPAQQRTARMGDTFYCLTRSGSEYCIASYSEGTGSLNQALPKPSDWMKSTPSFGFTPDINSFSASRSALFILDTDGNLFTSGDGLFWEPTGMKWHAVLGSYGDTLLGTLDTATGWQIQQWPSGAVTALPAGMPVSGNSVPVEYSFAMSETPQILIVGGRLADGSLTPATWGYDGSAWMKVSQKTLPVALEGMSVAPYYSLKINSYWDTEEMPSLLAFGGRDASGKINSIVYLSNDYGYHWSEAPQELQLPDYLTAVYDAQAFVMVSTLTGDLYVPKVSRPQVEWECPYIYLFGGMNAGGTLQNTVWRGFIQKFTFRPVL